MMRPFLWRVRYETDPASSTARSSRKRRHYIPTRIRMVVECSFGSIIAQFHLLGKAVVTRVENAVHVVTAMALLRNVIKRFVGFNTTRRANIDSCKNRPEGICHHQRETLHHSEELCLQGTNFAGYSSLTLWCLRSSDSAFHSVYYTCSHFFVM
jgi:hypothetical protein